MTFRAGFETVIFSVIYSREWRMFKPLRQSLNELERKIVQAVCIQMKERIEGSRVFAKGPTDEVETFAKFALDGSLKVLRVLLEKTG